jgi:3,4-dihydroxy 2-butanone 4-phosphate synthase/GTP cyclohydrolase II
MPFASIPEAIEEFRAGKMLVVVDDEDRENEGDLTVAAESITADVINFMAMRGRGLICLALSPERCDELQLPLMTSNNTSNYGTAFCEAIDARTGVSTGISAADRALTIRVAMDDKTRPFDLVRPGHVFPLRARQGGVLVRAGQTEAAVDLARLAGLKPGGVICEIMNEDGTMARVPELKAFCARHDLKMISVASLIRYRMQTEQIVKRLAAGTLHTAAGEFRTISFGSSVDPERHLAVLLGDVQGGADVLVRMHSHCLYGDVLGSVECECGTLLRMSLEQIAREGRGVLVYLHQTGPGIGATNGRLLPHSRDFMHYTTQEGQRQLQHEVGIGAQILVNLGLHKIRLLTNHPRKIVALDGFGIEITGMVPIGEGGA